MLLESSLGKLIRLLLDSQHCSVEWSFFFPSLLLHIPPSSSSSGTLMTSAACSKTPAREERGLTWLLLCKPWLGFWYRPYLITSALQGDSFGYSAHKAPLANCEIPRASKMSNAPANACVILSTSWGLSASITHALSHHLKKIGHKKPNGSFPHLKWKERTDPGNTQALSFLTSFRLVAISLWLSFLTAQHKGAHLWALFHSQLLWEQKAPEINKSLNFRSPKFHG